MGTRNIPPKHLPVSPNSGFLEYHNPKAINRKRKR